jgi:Tryptophan halogenase
MTKRIAVIGAGTAGAISAGMFLRHFPDDEIQWYFDSSISPQAVGEGSNLGVPRMLLNTINFRYQDLFAIQGTIKMGIAKYNWGSKNNYFFHDFGPPLVGYHFNAVGLQQHILSVIKDKVTVIDKNVTRDTIDADYVIDCSGRPKTFEDYNVLDCIPVNSVHVTQCFWDYPKFVHTLTIARKHGWVFGIPLQNRCSIGYLFNNNISSLEDVKEDVKEVFEQFGLQPSDTTNTFSFSSYYKKVNYTDRVAFNGNASFFSEPLEATTIGNMVEVNSRMVHIINNNLSLEKANKFYNALNRGVGDMISLHYFAGSTFNTPFWSHASTLATAQIRKACQTKTFRRMITAAVDHILANQSFPSLLEKAKTFPIPEWGSWPLVAYYTNIQGLGIAEQLKQVLDETK